MTKTFDVYRCCEVEKSSFLTRISLRTTASNRLSQDNVIKKRASWRFSKRCGSASLSVRCAIDGHIRSEWWEALWHDSAVAAFGVSRVGSRKIAGKRTTRAATRVHNFDCRYKGPWMQQLEARTRSQTLVGHN